MYTIKISFLLKSEPELNQSELTRSPMTSHLYALPPPTRAGRVSCLRDKILVFFQIWTGTKSKILKMIYMYDSICYRRNTKTNLPVNAYDVLLRE